MLHVLTWFAFLIHCATYVHSVIDTMKGSNEAICWTSAIDNLTLACQVVSNGTDVAGWVHDSCPALDVTVFADTSRELEINIDYTFHLSFQENGTYSSWYRLVLCRTEDVCYCDARKADGDGSSYLASSLEPWPQGSDNVNITLKIQNPGTFVVFGHVMQQILQNEFLHILQMFRGFTILVVTPPKRIVLANGEGFIVAVVVASRGVYANILLVMMFYYSGTANTLFSNWHSRHPFWL